jgi:transposase
VRDLWLDCLSEREIADGIGVTQPTIKEWVDKFTADAANLSPPGATTANSYRETIRRSWQ